MRIINFSGGSTIPVFKINYNRQEGERSPRGLCPAWAELLTEGTVMELYILQQLGDTADPV